MAVRSFILDSYIEYIYIYFRLLGRILRFDYIKSEFTAEDRRAQEDFKNLATVNKVGKGYLH